MNEIAVVDTGPLLHLTEIQQTPLLATFQTLLITPQVEQELIRLHVHPSLMQHLPTGLTVVPIRAEVWEEQQRRLAAFRVQPADISVAALAAQHSPDMVLTDDMELRKGLEAQGYRITGSIGILIRAFQQGRIPKAKLHALLDQLFDDSSLYLSHNFYLRAKNFINQLSPEE